MTIVVTFLCDDGVVVASDSMLTPSLGGINVGHHNGRKVYILEGVQLFAYAGDHGQGARVRAKAKEFIDKIEHFPDALGYVVDITRESIDQFHSTGVIGDQIEVNGALGFHFDGDFQSCVFEGMFQPRLLDADHYYAALGTGKLSADPFLKFLTDIFCKQGRPNVRQAIFLAAWVVQYVIDTNPGGVAGPIQISVLEEISGVVFARELETDEHTEAIASAGEALRAWRDSVQSGVAAEDAPRQPSPPGVGPTASF